MTLYNIDKLQSLKQEFLGEMEENGKQCTLKEDLLIASFLNFIEEQEYELPKDNGQLEIPFPDED